MTHASRYAPLAAFAAPARPRAEWWRLLVGLALIGALYFTVIQALITTLAKMLGTWRTAQILLELNTAGTPRGVVVLFSTFLPLCAAVLAATWLIHRRGPGTLIGPLPRAIAGFTRIALPLTALWVVLLPISTLSPEIGKSTPLSSLLAWAPVALPLLLVQVSAEELLFRGYLLQQLAARSTARLVWMVVPSALFGALHYTPGTFGANAIWPALWAAAFGCLAADLTARTGTIGAAIGLHFATNASALFLVGLYGHMDGLALYTIVINPRDPRQLLPWLAVDALALLISWLLARLVLRV